ncbi:MAG: PD40 domain-containing protein [Deltaproteobacteria bacterium]|nr:PD40 domain-containing protein [Deltaproteobacteria bacterium]
MNWQRFLPSVLAFAAACSTPTSSAQTSGADSGTQADALLSQDSSTAADQTGGDSADAAQTQPDAAAGQDTASPQDTSGKGDIAVGPPCDCKLVFTHIDLNANAVKIMQSMPDGTGATTLQENAILSSQPAGGRYVAMVGSPKAPSMRVMTLGGQLVAQVSAAGDAPIFGTVSADGKRVAWTRRLSDMSNDTELAVVNLDTSKSVTVKSMPSWETRPAFSPDGKWLVWYGADGKLHMADGSGNNDNVVLADISDDNDFRNGLSWSQDSKRLALTVLFNGANSNISLFDVGAAQTVALTSGPVRHQGPVFGYGDEVIYFTDFTADKSATIRRVSVQGGASEAVTDGTGYDVLPQPSPDGRYVAYARWTDQDNLGELRVFNVQTGAIQVVDTNVFNRAYWVAGL